MKHDITCALHTITCEINAITREAHMANDTCHRHAKFRISNKITCEM